MTSVEQAILEPAVGEYEDVVIEDIAGRIPDGLAGTLYRNGPARWEAGGFRAGHLFDGDGMLSKFTFRDGSLVYRNRYVRTSKYVAEERGQGNRVRGVATERAGGPVANAGRKPADRANTTAFYHADELLALSDDGRPWRIEPRTLETLGHHSFGGVLKPWALFSPHPKLDPHTGEMFNFGLSVPRTPRPGTVAALRCYRRSPQGRMTMFNSVDLPHLYINHDCGLTGRYMVFLLDPLYIKHPIRFGLGLMDANSAQGFDPDMGTRVVLVPRDGGRARVIETDLITKVHVNNAFDDGGDVVIDVVRYDDWDALSGLLTEFRSQEEPPGGILCRVRIRMDGTVTTEDRCDLPCEFPMHDGRRTTQDYRYSYLVHGDSQQPAIVKLDNESGAVDAHYLDPLDFPGEPVFVPRTGSAGEDDGWLLALNYNHSRHRTALVVLDAQRVDAGPVAVATLPHHFMPGFHGMFTPEIR